VKRIEVMAREKGYTPSQLALAWVLSRGGDVVPIFGTKRRKYLLENLKALEIRLTPADLARLEELAPKGAVAGDRYPAAMMSYIGR
jgi:aryl-alcohol dehydrogenase-like predicted oxidoreductase